jgi:hypothetical protein
MVMAVVTVEVVQILAMNQVILMVVKQVVYLQYLE